MAASIVANVNAKATSVTVASTPVAGDIVVLFAAFRGNAGTLSSVAGMGGTWTRLTSVQAEVGPDDTSNQRGSQDVWLGTGVTTSGAITTTTTHTGETSLSAWLLRGATTAVATSVVQSTTALNPRWGPSDTAAAGQVVIDSVTLYDSSPSYFASGVSPNTAPATGWAAPVLVGLINAWQRHYVTSRVPAEGSPTAHSTAGSAAVGSSSTHIQIVASPAGSATVHAGASTTAATSAATATATLRAVASVTVAAIATVAAVGIGIHNPTSTTDATSGYEASGSTIGGTTIWQGDSTTDGASGYTADAVAMQQSASRTNCTSTTSAAATLTANAYTVTTATSGSTSDGGSILQAASTTDALSGYSASGRIAGALRDICVTVGPPRLGPITVALVAHPIHVGPPRSCP
jgi:hypothetical protein